MESRAMASPQTTNPAGHVELMDRMYRLQRHIYDITRKYYLFGRDRLIARMPISDRHHVLEIGCGTGRNLLLLARKHPKAHFYGIDAANVMIEVAQRKVEANEFGKRIQLRHGLAETLDGRVLFQVDGFEHIFFSYSLSMIPNWEAAIEAAMDNLSPGGEIWVVDFWDQAGYPRLLAKLLTRWLALFHVHHRPELLAYLHQIQSDKRGSLTLKPIGRRYAYLARFVKAI